MTILSIVLLVQVIYIWYDDGEATLDLTLAPGLYDVSWYNPRTGGALVLEKTIGGGMPVTIKAASVNDDWLAVIKRNKQIQQ